MNWLKTAAAFLVGLAAMLVPLLSARAKQARAERDRANQARYLAEAANDYHQKQDAAMADLVKKQREETIDAQQKIADKRRDQLDADW